LLNRKKYCLLFLVPIIIAGCAGVTVHDDLNVSPGQIEGNQFTGIRYPFRVETPQNWKMATEFLDFLKEMGYEGPGHYDKEVTELYIFNPTTRSSLQIDFTPASPRAKFSQEKMEAITTAAAGSFKEELEKDYGKDIQAEMGPTTPFSLKGVQFAAKKSATYTLQGVKREQGWIYGFTESYQLFILYMILEKEGSNDRQDLMRILDSFQFHPQK
jgi:ABC-type molybdate transport system substrate-binding protein